MIIYCGVRYGWTAVTWGPTGLVGRWAGVRESPLSLDWGDCCDRSGRYHESGGGGGTTSRGGGGRYHESGGGGDGHG